ncbi:elongation factor Tu [Enterobacter sp. RIT418]|nr:elongation factor Tu [Enterobacter sp. RIT 418]
MLKFWANSLSLTKKRTLRRPFLLVCFLFYRKHSHFLFAPAPYHGVCAIVIITILTYTLRIF